ncbi:hypothetical protein KI387_044549, partial [Taxus chinensis]
FKTRRVSVPLHQKFILTLVKRVALDIEKSSSLTKTLEDYVDGANLNSKEEDSSEEFDSQEGDSEKDKD